MKNNTLQLQGWTGTQGGFEENVTPLQKYGSIVGSLIGFAIAIWIYFGAKPPETAVWMGLLVGAISLVPLYLGFTVEQRILDTNKRVLQYKSIWGGRILKEVSFDEISEIKGVDLTINGAYQGRYFYYNLSNGNNNPAQPRKISKPIVSKYDQSEFEDSLKKILFEK
jgi:uncharacterized membrane protein